MMPLESFLVKWHGIPRWRWPGGEAVRGHLIRHREHVHQVFHGKVRASLASARKRTAAFSGISTAAAK